MPRACRVVFHVLRLQTGFQLVLSRAFGARKRSKTDVFVAATVKLHATSAWHHLCSCYREPPRDKRVASPILPVSEKTVVFTFVGEYQRELVQTHSIEITKLQLCPTIEWFVEGVLP